LKDDGLGQKSGNGHYSLKKLWFGCH